ncbi:MAG TPA: hypothetical protein PK589_18545 [Nitrospira sp.]|nr:hypothetical protein [Nitrospira sp.]HNG55593.1 hypothetical protein [Nitrospira sp.]HNJ21667.1 hypothetical protein [Nitrospira sp.]HNO34554.1 hypothetical protein [Nitrospira sp.]
MKRPTQKSVAIQVKTGGRWYEFGLMNYVERRELADILRKTAEELEK